MKLLVVQLSDVHLKNADNIVLSRVAAIKQAVQGVDPSFAACLVAMTGDVVFSGQKEEYDVAETFFDQIRKGIQSIRPGIQVEEVFIPGNHDCVLPTNKISARKVITGHLLQSGSSTDQPDVALVQDCLEAQDNFFEFLARRSSGGMKLQEVSDRLHYTVELTLADQRLVIYCYNTAWMSQRNEQPGQLLAPIWLSQDQKPNVDLVLSLFHHPYGWIEPINAKAFRKLIEETSDIVMTGHEHVSDQYSKQTIRGERSEYFEGAVLQEGNNVESGFNTVVFDIERKECQVTLYEWQEDHYVAKEKGEWKTFRRDNRHVARPFEPTQAFTDWLQDAGAAFSHPRKDTLRLPDFFVYPSLQDDVPVKSKMGGPIGSVVREEQLFDYISSHNHLLILGEQRSGRTSLAKTLYGDFLRRTHVPVLLNGDHLRGSEESAFIKVVDHAVRDQYGSDMVERFWQRDQAEKVLIIDDLHRCRLNHRGMNAVVEHACQTFGTVILLADDLFQIEEITHAVEEQATLLSFRRCVLRPLGHRLRHKIIEKWYRLGQEYTIDEAELAENIREAENVVNTLIGKNLLPPYPLFVLTLLQTYEARTYHNTALGAYGYHYEALITAALAHSIQQARSRIMVGTVYTLVSGIAFRMFQQSRSTLSEVEMNDAIDTYKSAYGMRFNNDEMLAILKDGRLINKEADSHYAFSYRYVYYYFVARFINENLASEAQGEALRQRVADMTAKLYVEEYANVVIFLVYFTKDEQIIAGILAHARTLYAEYEPCDLDTHLSFASHLTGKPLPLQLEEGNLQRHNEQYRHHLDEAESLRRTSEEDEARLKADQGFDDILKLNASLKTLEVMGQILRNFPGSLPVELKLEIATESYLLGLRTLRAIYGVMEENLEPLRLFFSEVVKQLRHIEDADKLAKLTDELLYSLIFGCSYGLIKRVSQAVGSDQLEETYSKIKDPRSPISIALIDLSIKLDHFRLFPATEVDAIAGMATKNTFATSLLRCLVRDHFYLYPVNYKIRQAVCQKLGITINDANMLTPRKKA